jgi:hypothetical protein
MTNAHRKEYRAASWRRSEDRHRRNAEEQKKREEANRALRKAGKPVPWEEAEAARKKKRA